MKRTTYTIVSASLIVAGFTAGNLLAQTAPALSFKKATLFGAMQKLHTQTAANIVFVNREATEKTFDLPAEGHEAAISGAAKQYGLDAVSVSHITVLEKGLPDGAAPMDRLAAVRAMVGDRQRLADYDKGIYGLAEGLSSDLPEGTHPFSSLSLGQQQAAIDLLRSSGALTETINLILVLQSYDEK